jgi:hypothetical protein
MAWFPKQATSEPQFALEKRQPRDISSNMG